MRDAILKSLLRRISYATSFSTALWILATAPLGFSSQAVFEGLLSLLKLLDLPVALTCRLLPDPWDGLFAVHRPSTPTAFWRYLCVAVPVYVAVTYLPGLIRGTRNWMRRRRASTGSRMATAKR
jgi:hypothetical protein